MSLLAGIERFISQHVVTRVDEPTALFEARTNLPALIEGEIARYQRELDSGRFPNLDLTTDSLIRSEQALRYARDAALKPRRSTLEWKLFRRPSRLPLASP